MRATPGNYPHQAMPERRAELDLNRTFDRKQYAALIEGSIPRRPDDRWFVFEEYDWISLHLSANGTCIYRIRLEGEEENWRVAEAWVNRDPEQYDSTDDAADATLLNSLLDRIIKSNGR